MKKCLSRTYLLVTPNPSLPSKFDGKNRRINKMVRKYLFFATTSTHPSVQSKWSYASFAALVTYTPNLAFLLGSNTPPANVIHSSTSRQLPPPSLKPWPKRPTSYHSNIQTSWHSPLTPFASPLQTYSTMHTSPTLSSRTNSTRGVPPSLCTYTTQFTSHRLT